MSEGALLLDVRTPAEFAAGAPVGALDIPVQELAARVEELPRDRTIIAYCRSGARSAAAVARLTAASFDAYDAGASSNVM